MSKAVKKIKTTDRELSFNLLPQLRQRLYEGLIVLTLGVSFYLWIALWSFSPQDAGWSHTGLGLNTVENSAGETGAWLANLLIYWIGLSAYIFPVLFLFAAITLFQTRKGKIDYSMHLLLSRLFGAIITILSFAAFLSLHVSHAYLEYPMGIGGLFGKTLSFFTQKYFNVVGGTLVLTTVFLFAITLLTGFSWAELLHSVLLSAKQYLTKLLTLCWIKSKQIITRFANIIKKAPSYFIKKRKHIKSDIFISKDECSKELPVIELFPNNELKSEDKPKVESKKPSIRRRLIQGISKNKIKVPTYVPQAADLPSFDLLDAEDNSGNKVQQLSDNALQALSSLVEEKLADFGVAVKVVAIHPGPVITRFELKLAPGVKVSKISTLAKDLARSLSVMSVRVVEIIPGKPVIGLELPNEHRQTVQLKEILNTSVYQQMTSPLTLALGKDIAGISVAVDLAKMPHLLVAGTTGSGKSVGLNGMILSLLYKSSPDKVRFIMIDPKMLELSIYAGIPHLLAPVVTDMKEASNALRWAVAEMERRYQLMASFGVRNLAGFNKKVIEAEQNGQPLYDPNSVNEAEDAREELKSLPNIVIIVDELADLMMVVGKKVEELIARIAQKARAAGIHLILATQRPSVDVITGLIKANIPTRIAYQVASRIDSRTILDQQGAEQLLGQGDMLYLPTGAGLPTRVHGAFVSDKEVHRVVKHWRDIAEPDYQEEIVYGLHQKTQNINPNLLMQEPEDKLDSLYDEAVKIVTETQRASISLVQRKLKIGYNRSARLLEQMEQEGVVSAMQQNGTREVLAPPPVEVE